MSVVLAFASAMVLGSADFCGGLAAKRANVFAVVIWSNVTGLLVALLINAVLGGSGWSVPDILWGGAAGIAGCVGALLLYKALASGVMTVVAPTTAAVAAAVPVIAGITLGNHLSMAAGTGIGLGVVAVWLVSRTADDGSADPRQGLGSVLMSLLAGAGFGAFFVFLSFTDSGSSLWPLVWARVASVFLLSVVLISRRTPVRLPRLAAAQAMLSGALDMISSALFVVAVRGGDIAVVGLLASLYPVSTVFLARIVLGERLRSVQAIGVVLAMVTVVLLSVA
jgi:uncharacterized membrane protein